MGILEIVLIAAVVVLAVALVASLASRRKVLRSHGRELAQHRDHAADAHARAERQEAAMHHTRADTTEELAQERSARQRLEAELHEARARIAELERGDGRSQGRGRIFQRSGS